MKLFLNLRSWQLFLIFFVPGYIIPYIPLIVVIGFILTIYSFWIYSIALFHKSKITESGVHKLHSDFFKLSCILFPILWIVSFYYQVYESNHSVPFYLSLLCLLALFQMIYFSCKTLLKLSIGIKLIWIIIGLLIPIIGV